MVKFTHHARSRLDFGSESRNPLGIEKPRSNEIGSSLKRNIYMAPPRSVGVEQRVGPGLRQVQVTEAALLLGLAFTLISGCPASWFPSPRWLWILTLAAHCLRLFGLGESLPDCLCLLLHDFSRMLLSLKLAKMLVLSLQLADVALYVSQDTLHYLDPILSFRRVGVGV